MMRKGTRLLLWTCVGLLLVGLIACEATMNSGGSSVTNSQTGAAGKRTVSAEEKKLDEEVFPKDRVVDVKITIDEADFQDMLDNASAEEFKTASVDYNGHHFDNVGIRTKGNLSLRSVVQMSDSDRYSFKLSFDEYVNQTLEGIQKINLNNNYSDATYMREFLTYELSEQMGLPTPKHSYVNVYINGELWGFYLAVEQIGDAYLERNFGNAYGALYKGEMTGSGSDLTWLGDDLSAYTGLVQKSKSSNGDILIKMLDELNNGSNYEKYINVPDALGYIALNTLTNNMDSYIGANKQNYYLYEDDGVFSILPWDYNMAFGGMGRGGGGFGRGANGGAGGGADGAGGAAGATGAADGGAQDGATGGDDAGAARGQPQAGAGADAQGGAAAPGGGSSGRSNLLIDEPTQGAVADRPLVAKLLAVDEYKVQYHDILQSAIDNFLENDKFSARVTELSEMISSYVKADPTAFYTYEEYEQAVPQLISTNASQIENIQQQLDGTIASSGDGSGSGGGFGGMGGGRTGRAAAQGQSQAQAGAGAEPSAPTTSAADGAPGSDGAPAGQGGPPPQAGGNGAAGEAGGPPALPDGMQPPEGFTGDAGALGAAAEGAGEARPAGGFPGGDFPGGGRGLAPSAQPTGSRSEALATGIALLVLLAAAAFVAFFRRKRL
ncbi:CotH protein [Paenibacillus barengoltzii]|uniref:CotH kinase family protein n=1 Tax=Paenibacillus barengoltzii TaxID=343517 RepID=UPI000A08476B|nr:CotH protein [Paenibacillus barengoltzii]